MLPKTTPDSIEAAQDSKSTAYILHVLLCFYVNGHMQCNTTSSPGPLTSSLPHGWCLTVLVSQVCSGYMQTHCTWICAVCHVPCVPCAVQTRDTSHNMHCFAGCQNQTCWVYQGLTVRLSTLCFQTFQAQLQHQMPTSGNGVTLAQHRCCMSLPGMLMQSHSQAQ